MNCLVIAAGYGSRLSSVSGSKPLTPIAGTPMIERAIQTAAAAGATRFVVVTGHEAERLESFLDDFAARSGLDITAVRTDDWSRPNGYSVMSGAAALDGDYLLLMSDHLFDPAILKKLIAKGPHPNGLTLAVDYRLHNPLIDPADATRVAVGPDGMIRAIGKGLSSFDATDTGAFLASPALKDAIGRSIAGGGKGSLSEGVQILADANRAATMDTGDLWWLDVDEPQSLESAERYMSEARRA